MRIDRLVRSHVVTFDVLMRDCGTNRRQLVEIQHVVVEIWIFLQFALVALEKDGESRPGVIGRERTAMQSVRRQTALALVCVRCAARLMRCVSCVSP